MGTSPKVFRLNSITNAELFAAHHAGERAFLRHLDVYRQLDNEWICAARQQIGMTFAVGLVALLQSLRRLAMEGSSERGRAVSDFKGRHFGGEIVLWAVRWYC